MRHRGIIALGLLALPLAGCAPLPESLTWEQWAAEQSGADGSFDFFSGRVIGGGYDGGNRYQQTNDVFSNVPLAVTTIDLYCRSTEPVVFTVTDAEPVEVDCEEGDSIEVLVKATTRVEPSFEGRAYWLAVARPEPDAFVDGEPVEP